MSMSKSRRRSRKPKFERYGWRSKKKLSKSWRKPRGLDNKLREHIAAKGAWVKVGYRRKREERGLHPSGIREVLVYNPRELENLMPDEVAVRIASGVGGKKREQIEAEAASIGLRVLNPSSSSSPST